MKEGQVKAYGTAALWVTVGVVGGAIVLGGLRWAWVKLKAAEAA